MSQPIPFNRPYLVGKEFDYIRQAIDSGCISGDGEFTQRCQSFLEGRLGVRKALLTTSCTHALEMAALLLDLKPGDEIIVPSFTFVSTVNAFVLRGVKPVFIDIRPDTLNLDETQIEALITPRTRAIVPVHYGGVGCEMDAILDIARQHGLTVIEDNAHGLFGTYRDRPLGTFGTFAAQSFHETKNIICGEGGALLVNDENYIERAEVVWEKGTNRRQFHRGEADHYTWIDVGSSYLPSDILAAYLLAQLEAVDVIQAVRERIWNRYHAGLSEWAVERKIDRQIVPPHCRQPYHLYYLLMPSAGQRQAMIQHLKERDIQSVFHYLPLHLSPMGKQYGGREGLCPVTEDLSGRLLRLPFFNQLSEADQDEVIQAVKDFPTN